MQRIHAYAIAFLVLAVASVTINVLIVTGHLFRTKPRVRFIEAPYKPTQQTQEPAGQERPAVSP